MQGVARSLRELSRVPSYASAEASQSIARLIQYEFATGTDPYGKPWKPLKPSTVARKGHATINVDTHALKDGIQVKPMPGAGIQVTIDADYAAYVQRVRPVLPTGRLPKAWGVAINDAIQEAKRRWAKAAMANVDPVDAMLELSQLLDAAAE